MLIFVLCLCCVRVHCAYYEIVVLSECIEGEKVSHPTTRTNLTRILLNSNAATIFPQRRIHGTQRSTLLSTNFLYAAPLFLFIVSWLLGSGLCRLVWPLVLVYIIF